MRSSKLYQRFHLTRNGWVDDYTYRYIMGTKTERLLTRQYGSMEEINFDYYKDIWQHRDVKLPEIYLILYPHPISNIDYCSYHEVGISMNN